MGGLIKDMKSYARLVALAFLLAAALVVIFGWARDVMYPEPLLMRLTGAPRPIETGLWL